MTLDSSASAQIAATVVLCTEIFQVQQNYAAASTCLEFLLRYPFIDSLMIFHPWNSTTSKRPPDPSHGTQPMAFLCRCSALPGEAVLEDADSVIHQDGRVVAKSKSGGQVSQRSQRCESRVTEEWGYRDLQELQEMRIGLARNVSESFGQFLETSLVRSKVTNAHLTHLGLSLFCIEALVWFCSRRLGKETPDSKEMPSWQRTTCLVSRMGSTDISSRSQTRYRQRKRLRCLMKRHFGGSCLDF